MTCTSVSTLKGSPQLPMLPSQPPTTSSGWQALRIIIQTILQQIQGAAGATGVNVIPQQYALFGASTLPPITATNCTVALDTSTVLFGVGSLKITITGANATVSFGTGFPMSPNASWLISFFTQASAQVAGSITITTPSNTYTTAFTSPTGSGWQRLYDTLNLVADDSTSFGVSFSFPNASGQTVWIDGSQMEPWSNVPMGPSPFISTSPALNLDHLPDGSSYLRIASTHVVDNVAYNFKGTWQTTINYMVGDEVTYAGGYWLATNPSLNSAPGPANANWQAVGATAGLTQTLWKNTASGTASLGTNPVTLLPGIGTGSLVIGANTMSVGTQLRAIVSGFVSTAPTANSDTFPQIQLGATYIGSTTTGSGFIPSTSLGYPFHVEATLTCTAIGASGSCIGTFYGVCGASGGVSTWGDSVKGGAVALNTTVDNTFNLLMTVGGACALTLVNASLEQL